MKVSQSPVAYRDGKWHISGCPLSEIAAEFSTPLFIYDRQILDSQFSSLRDALPDVVDLYYSIKANPNPAIVSHFAACTAGLEVASAAEYEVARKAGAQIENILFAGPGKTADELEHVLRGGIGEIHIESSEELAALESLGIPVNVSIRFNPASEASGGAMRMGGKPSQFGFDEEQLPEIVDRVRAASGLNLNGLHMFAGTQLLDADVLLSQWSHAVSVARRVAAHIGGPLNSVDLGGGLGIPYFKGETALDLKAVRTGATRLFGGLTGDPLFSGTRFIVEPGRFLAGPAGVYVGRVVSVKHSRGTRFVIMDGGMNHHLAASGNLGQVIKKDYPIINVSRPDDALLEPAVVVGPLCTPLDTLGRRVNLPLTEPGDLIAVMQSGAYGLSASPVGFLSHRLPAEILVSEQGVDLIAPRGTFSNPLCRQATVQST
jgi:diaminopimelate decarboxylase